MKYRFLVDHPPFSKGEPVPDEFSPGMIHTMLEYRRIEVVSSPEKKAMTTVPFDKMVRAERLKRK